MRITQGTFSYLPDFTDEEIEAQVKYSLNHGWAMMVEYTDDPHPRNFLWEMWKQPEFDLEPDDSETPMKDVHDCREAYPNHYIRLVAYDPRLGSQSPKLSFIVNRPQEEPGYRLERTETHDRTINYTLRPYVLDEASGRRYGNQGTLSVQRDPAAVQEAVPGIDSPKHGEDGASADDEPEAQSDEGVGES